MIQNESSATKSLLIQCELIDSVYFILSKIDIYDPCWVLEFENCNDAYDEPEENLCDSVHENPSQNDEVDLMFEGEFVGDVELMKSMGLPLSFGGDCLSKNTDHGSNRGRKVNHINHSVDSDAQSDSSDDDPFENLAISTDAYSQGVAFQEYWHLHGENLIWESWCEKYSDYIDPQYLLPDSNCVDEHASENSKGLEVSNADCCVNEQDPDSVSMKDNSSENSNQADWTELWQEHRNAIYHQTFETFNERYTVNENLQSYEDKICGHVNNYINQTVYISSRQDLSDADDLTSDQYSEVKKRIFEEVDGDKCAIIPRNLLKATGFTVGMQKNVELPHFNKLRMKFKNRRLRKKFAKILNCELKYKNSPIVKAEDDASEIETKLTTDLSSGSNITVDTNDREIGDSTEASGINGPPQGLEKIDVKRSDEINGSGIDDSETTKHSSTTPDHENIVASQSNHRGIVKKKKRSRRKPWGIKRNPSLKKFWNRRYSLFSKYDEGIHLDEESWYSVTPEQLARHHAMRCQGDVIVDTCCGAGGNAIQFALHRNHVIAIDIDPNKLSIARKNAEVYGVANKINFIQGDLISVLRSLKFADTIFFDPPWGGVDVNKMEVFDIETMMKPRASDMFEVARKLTNNIAIYVPRNVNAEQLLSLAGPGQPVEIEKNHYNGRLLTVTAYYGGLVTDKSA